MLYISNQKYFAHMVELRYCTHIFIFWIYRLQFCKVAPYVLEQNENAFFRIRSKPSAGNAAGCFCLSAGNAEPRQDGLQPLAALGLRGGATRNPRLCLPRTVQSGRWLFLEWTSENSSLAAEALLALGGSNLVLH